jgi:DNA-binding XRE family transcriptional regulator
VRPEHLEGGTIADNNHDMVLRERQARGILNGMVKLTEEQIRAIRRQRAAGALQAQLAEEYGVAQPTISMIVNGKAWTHV